MWRVPSCGGSYLLSTHTCCMTGLGARWRLTLMLMHQGLVTSRIWLPLASVFYKCGRYACCLPPPQHMHLLYVRFGRLNFDADALRSGHYSNLPAAHKHMMQFWRVRAWYYAFLLRDSGV